MRTSTLFMVLNILLLSCCSNNKAKLDSLLLKAKKDNLYPIHWAVVNDNIDGLKLFIKNKYDMNHQSDVTKSHFVGDIGKWSALHFAVLEKRISMITYFVNEGGDTNLQDIHGETALHFAIREMDEEIVKLLIKSKINLNTVNKKGRTALHIAVKKHADEIAKQLIYAGANLSIKSNYGKKPVDLVSVYSDEELIKLLAK